MKSKLSQVPGSISGAIEVFRNLLRRGRSARLLGGQSSLQRWQQTPGSFPRLLGHERINDNQSRHSLDDRNRTRHHTRIMSPFRLQCSLLSIIGRCLLSLADGGRRLECDAEVDVLAIRDTALNATGVIRLGDKFRAVCLVAVGVGDGRGDERVIVRRARDLAASETRADFETFGCGNAQHRVCERCFKLVEARLA